MPFEPREELENLNNYQRLTIDKLNTEGCINLLEAFLKELNTEYCAAYSYYLSSPNSKNAKGHYENIKKFIKSKYFKRLTGLDPDGVIDTLDGRRSSDWRVIYG